MIRRIARRNGWRRPGFPQAPAINVNICPARRHIPKGGGWGWLAPRLADGETPGGGNRDSGGGAATGRHCLNPGAEPGGAAITRPGGGAGG